MLETKYAGKAMRSYFRRMSEINATQDFERQGELGRELERDLIEAYSPEGPNWKRGNRLISDMHTSQTDSPVGESWVGFERYCEDITSGVRLGVFYDIDGNLIGRHYFDRGDIPAEIVRSHLRFWESTVYQGRPLVESPLRFSDEQIYQMVEEIRTRGSSRRHQHSTPGAVKNAIGLFLTESGQLSEELSDMDHDKLFEENKKAYQRGQKRVKKKSG